MTTLERIAFSYVPLDVGERQHRHAAIAYLPHARPGRAAQVPTWCQSSYIVADGAPV